MIEKAMYFSHGKHQDKLTNVRDMKELDKFLREPFANKKFNGTNFEYIISIWNDNNSVKIVKEDIEQPDYSYIEDYKR